MLGENGTGKTTFLQTTIQMGNFYASNLDRYNLSTIVAQAPGRLSTPNEAKNESLESLDTAKNANHGRPFAICDVPPISATSRPPPFPI